MTEAFFKKHPNADPSRFVSKNGKVWFKLNPNNEDRLVDIEYRSFYDSKEWVKYLTSFKKRGFGIFFSDGTIQPYKENKALDDIHTFKAYVNKDQFFTTNLPPPTTDNSSSADYRKNPYLAAVIGAYVATYVCGVSTNHFIFDEKTPKVVTSIMRYHLYYQIMKFLKDPSLLNRYISNVPNIIKNQKTTRDVWTKAYHQGRTELMTWLIEQPNRDKIRNYKYSTNARGAVTGIVYEKVTGQEPKDVDDYKKFIATTTNGLTKIGQKLIQQSIESYVYSVLGAQASLRFPIVGEGAKSLQTQDKFHTIVKETIAQSDVAITTLNMRTAIASTNVVLNMAISPGMILIPSNLIIQKEKVAGYNNVLTLATDKMKFGKNAEVNYKIPKTVKSSKTSVTQGGNTTPDTPKSSETLTQGGDTPKPKSPKISVASEILGMTMMVGGFLISKYVF